VRFQPERIEGLPEWLWQPVFEAGHHEKLPEKLLFSQAHTVFDEHCDNDSGDISLAVTGLTMISALAAGAASTSTPKAESRASGPKSLRIMILYLPFFLGSDPAIDAPPLVKNDKLKNI
jgi:hypothetical protein